MKKIIITSLPIIAILFFVEALPAREPRTNISISRKKVKPPSPTLPEGTKDEIIVQIQQRNVTLENENIKLKIHLQTALKQVELEKEQAKKLSEDIDRLKKKVSAVTETYLVRKDDSLWRIAQKKETYNDAYKWLLLYHANKDIIYDPNLIYPNMVLLVPRLPGTEKEE